MTRWPDFFIVGATRAGTTSLYYYLRGHPDIFMASVKEPHYFSDMRHNLEAVRRRPLPVRVIGSEQDYLKLFEKARPDEIAGEASTSYLSSNGAPARIKTKNSMAKIVAILREPVDRAYASYLLSIREGREQNPSFYGALQDDYEYMIKFGDDNSYIRSGLYYERVKQYLDTFGKEQVRVYLYDDLVADTTALVQNLCCFLGVPFYDGSFFDPDQKYHTYGIPRNALFKWVGRSRAIRSVAAAVAPMHLLIPLRDRLVDRQQVKPPLDPQAREFLRSIYYEDTLKLQELIGRDLSNWLS